MKISARRPTPAARATTMPDRRQAESPVSPRSFRADLSAGLNPGRGCQLLRESLPGADKMVSHALIGRVADLCGKGVGSQDRPITCPTSVRFRLPHDLERRRGEMTRRASKARESANATGETRNALPSGAGPDRSTDVRMTCGPGLIRSTYQAGIEDGRIPMCSPENSAPRSPDSPVARGQAPTEVNKLPARRAVVLVIETNKEA